VKKDERRLKAALDEVLAQYHGRAFLKTDPISIPHGYEGLRDREFTGFVAAMFAFGNVRSMLPAIRVALDWLGMNPVQSLINATHRDIEVATAGFGYRWVKASDLASFLRTLQSVYADGGSLEGLYRGGRASGEGVETGGLSGLLDGLQANAPNGALTAYGTRYMLPSSGGKGAYKRVHLFLRWMVRSDVIDLGVWKSVHPRQLMMPLDTHVSRISRLLGLSDRKTPDGRMAREITERLRRFDPEDPVKYDFALSRLGIIGACPSKRVASACAPCSLKPSCRYWR
jgi:uncharacterized protein (TIGR02757 family)